MRCTVQKKTGQTLRETICCKMTFLFCHANLIVNILSVFVKVIYNRNKLARLVMPKNSFLWTLPIFFSCMPSSDNLGPAVASL